MQTNRSEAGKALSRHKTSEASHPTVSARKFVARAKKLAWAPSVSTSGPAVQRGTPLFYGTTGKRGPDRRHSWHADTTKILDARPRSALPETPVGNKVRQFPRHGQRETFAHSVDPHTPAWKDLLDRPSGVALQRQAPVEGVAESFGDDGYATAVVEDSRKLLHQYAGQFLEFGPDGTAITILDADDDDQVEVHFRASLFLGQNIRPGESFTYEIFDTGSGSQSQVCRHVPTALSYSARAELATRAREIACGLVNPETDGNP